MKAPVLPLVTCMIVTGGRVAFLRRAYRYFCRQTYPPKEFLVVDDGATDLAPFFRDERVRYFRVPGGLSIGTKRNIACELARGNIVLQWDDDDWFGDGRIGYQLAPLLRNEADICALRTGLVLDLCAWRFWTMSDDLHRELFYQDVHGGTLAFRRSIWLSGVRYPDRSLGEDARFLRFAIDAGARLTRQADGGEFVYVRHTTNAWQFACGSNLRAASWFPQDEPAFMRRDLAFYLRMRQTIARGDGS
jgi:glycosyltransferase involved in cell wall biosynthesis